MPSPARRKLSPAAAAALAAVNTRPRLNEVDPADVAAALLGILEELDSYYLPGSDRTRLVAEDDIRAAATELEQLAVSMP